MLQSRGALLLACGLLTSGAAFLTSALLPWLAQGSAYLALLTSGDTAQRFVTSNGFLAALSGQWVALQAAAGLLFSAFGFAAAAATTSILVALERVAPVRLALPCMLLFAVGFTGTVVAAVKVYALWQSGCGGAIEGLTSSASLSTGFASGVAGSVVSFVALLASKVVLHMPVEHAEERLSPPAGTSGGVANPLHAAVGAEVGSGSSPSHRSTAATTPLVRTATAGAVASSPMRSRRAVEAWQEDAWARVTVDGEEDEGGLHYR